jgi:hypothetical protein
MTTARTAPFFPVAATGDGVTKTFALGFTLLQDSHARIIVNGALKVLGTDYGIVDGTSRNPLVRFFTAPTNAYALKFYRNTPIGLISINPEISHVEARQVFNRLQEKADERVRVPFIFPVGTLITTPTAYSFVAPFDGYFGAMNNTVEQTITTGGTLTPAIDGVTVAGAVATIANSAAAGLNAQTVPTTQQASTTQFRKGQTISITPASFATAGAVSGTIELIPADF